MWAVTRALGHMPAILCAGVYVVLSTRRYNDLGELLLLGALLLLGGLILLVFLFGDDLFLFGDDMCRLGRR